MFTSNCACHFASFNSISNLMRNVSATTLTTHIHPFSTVRSDLQQSDFRTEPQFCFTTKQITNTNKRILKTNNQNIKHQLRSITNSSAEPLNLKFEDPSLILTQTLTPEQNLFENLSDESHTVSIETLTKNIFRHGLRQSDPRLNGIMENIKLIQSTNDRSRFNMDFETFSQVVSSNVDMVQRAMCGQLVVPEFERFTDEVTSLYHKQARETRGRVADYIPQLARADPEKWGVSVCTVDGQRISVGDAEHPFCLQSCAKPLTYALAVTDQGSEKVHDYVGLEPSGRSFNLLELDNSNRPHNPMVNSGGIVTTSLVRPRLNIADRFDYILSVFKKTAGDEFVGFNNAVFQSERVNADRNFALGYFMREHRCFPPGTNLMEVLDLYFQLCSMEVTCDSGSVMAATLANGGISPLSGERVLDAASVRNTLSLMHSCGMYDYSGQFAFTVGLPAKSGVAGGILIVVPNVMGICVFSPPLDEHGNSVRGIGFARNLVERFNFHRYDDLIRSSQRKSDPTRMEIEEQNENVINLMFSASNGEYSAIKRMHTYGYDMSAMDYDRRTPLHLAATEGHLDIVKYLVEQCHVDPEPSDRWGSVPLGDAQTFEQWHVVEYLNSIFNSTSGFTTENLEY